MGAQGCLAVPVAGDDLVGFGPLSTRFAGLFVQVTARFLGNGQTWSALSSSRQAGLRPGWLPSCYSRQRLVIRPTRRPCRSGREGLRAGPGREADPSRRRSWAQRCSSWWRSQTALETSDHVGEALLDALEVAVELCQPVKLLSTPGSLSAFAERSRPGLTRPGPGLGCAP